MELLRIVAPHFVAGVLINAFNGRVAVAAPIVRWTIGKTRAEIMALRNKGWIVEEVS